MRILLVVLVLLLPLSYALTPANPVNGYANLQVNNEAPILHEVQLSPTTVYKDTALECLANVEDEQLSSVMLHYTWKINGQVNPEQGYKLTGFHEKDEISCTVYAEDNVHQLSGTKSLPISVSSAPWHVHALSTALSGVGIQTDMAHAVRLENQGLPAVTGYVIDESGKNGTNVLFLVVFGLLFLAILNANLFLRYHLKKHVE
jgi:hypothetical protein